MPSESISLAIGGLSYAAWESWSVDSDLRTPADAFELSLQTKDSASLPKELVEGVACTLTLDADRVLTGLVDKVRHEVSRGGVTLKVEGRDMAAVLVDCSAPPLTLRNAGLTEIVERLVKPLGISQIEVRPSSEVRRLVQYHPTKTAWKALKEVAALYGVQPWMEADGRLVLGAPDYQATPVGTLILRLDGKGNNVMGLSVERSFVERYSQITALAQHGQYDNDGLDPDRAHGKAVVQDKSLTRYKPLVCEVWGDSQLDVSAYALDVMRDGNLESLKVEATVKGHRNAAGSVWTPGQRVVVRSEPHGLDGTFFLIARKLSLSRTGGPLTVLQLRKDGLWKASKTGSDRNFVEPSKEA